MEIENPETIYREDREREREWTGSTLKNVCPLCQSQKLWRILARVFLFSSFLFWLLSYPCVSVCISRSEQHLSHGHDDFKCAWQHPWGEWRAFGMFICGTNTTHCHRLDRYQSDSSHATKFWITWFIVHRQVHICSRNEYHSLNNFCREIDMFVCQI